MSVIFSSDSSELMSPVVNIELDLNVLDDITSQFELYRCSKWIKDYKYSKVALQFADSQLKYSFQIANWLEIETKIEIYVLGDTSYGSCCVDEVTAEHVSANAIIHFGRACLSPTTRNPVLYIFGQEPFDVDDPVQKCQQFCPDPKTPIVLLFDVVYSYAIDNFSTRLLSNYSHVAISALKIPIPGGNSMENTAETSHYCCGRVINPPPGFNIHDCVMLYIGCADNLTGTNLFLTFNKNRFLSYNPATKQACWDSVHTNKTLRRRYYLIEKAKDSRIVGILVGTLGVENYLKIIAHLKKLIRDAGKRVYTLAVGKPNPAKLANFAEVDVFVLVACPQNSLLDCRDYFRPIVTPFELEIALNKGRTWDGQYVTDFNDILKGGKHYKALEKWEQQQTDVSLISGNLRTLGLNADQELSSDDANVVELRSEMTVAPIHEGGAGRHLASRHWRGLDQQLGNSPVTKATEGKHGLAASYTEEPNVNY